MPAIAKLGKSEEFIPKLLLFSINIIKPIDIIIVILCPPSVCQAHDSAEGRDLDIEPLMVRKYLKQQIQWSASISVELDEFRMPPSLPELPLSCCSTYSVAKDGVFRQHCFGLPG